MKFRDWNHEHSVLLVSSASPVGSIRITSEFRIP